MEISLPEYGGETSNYSCQTKGKGRLESLRSRWIWKREFADNCQVVLLSSYNTFNVASEENNYGNENIATIVFASV